ncbi:SRPBCC domain-containing protein [Amycolatopsis anabasis]|uniref:SRPBCC domain-containing protein n=1 Tax=Amycolatopsis anabasis TaxID=1840409 RepID=UPI00131E7B4D|nr:SRPBCC domain-containing protein [Amycolatopsis anabasis]
MMDVVGQIEEAHRELGNTGKGRSVLIRRDYDATVEDVWDACTTADRIGRWLGPVTGDLRLDGHYQLEGNAGGTILRCEPPRLLRVTWVYGENPGTNTSEVEVRLSPAADGKTTFELEHGPVDLDPEFWARFGPGATGLGWDLSLLGLAALLSGEDVDVDAHEELLKTPEAVEFLRRSGRAWQAAHEASGATAEAAAGAAERTIAAYTEPPPSGN